MNASRKIHALILFLVVMDKFNLTIIYIIIDLLFHNNLYHPQSSLL